MLYIIKRKKLFNLTSDNVYDLILIAVPCGIIGARLYYILFNIDQFFGAGNWSNILRTRDGGLAIYGGIIASGLVFILYSRFKKIQLGNLLDAAGFGLFIGQAVGRWGNFFNREAFGTATDLPWRMGLTFDQARTIDGVSYSAGQTAYFHPTFLYEMLWNVIGLLAMHIFSKRSKTKYPGQYFLFYVAWYGLGRFMIEGLRIDSLFIHGTGIRASQLLAAISFLAAVGILLYNHFRADKGEKLALADGEDSSDEEPDEDVGAEGEDVKEKTKGTAKSDKVDEDADDDADDSADSETDEDADDDADSETDEDADDDTDSEADENSGDDADSKSDEKAKSDKKAKPDKETKSNGKRKK